MGKSGFTYIKGKFWGVFKKIAPPDEVSEVRYRVGLVMFSLPILFGWVGPYGLHGLPAYEKYHLPVNIISDILLISSFFVLGGDFWDKLRGLFIRNAKIQVPAHDQNGAS